MVVSVLIITTGDAFFLQKTVISLLLVAGSSLSLAVDGNKVPVTVLDALTTWISLNGKENIQYTDVCYGNIAWHQEYVIVHTLDGIDIVYLPNFMVWIHIYCLFYMLVYILTGSLCNSQCPDELILGEPTSNKWHIGVKLAIVVLVGLSITCIVIKWMFFVWLHHLIKQLSTLF